MSDPMQEIRASFFTECDELLEGLFDALQSMSDSGADGETINVAFRSVHSIKGGAGAFNLIALVDFAHEFETVLDLLRNEEIAANKDLLDLFFRCGDTLSDLVRLSSDNETIAPSTYADIVSDLAKYIPKPSHNVDEEEVEFTPTLLDITSDLTDISIDQGSVPSFDEAAEVESDLLEAPISDTQKQTGIPDETKSGSNALTVTFHPEPELYVAGNEPFFLVRNLADFGPCDTDVEFIPWDNFDQIGASSCLTWTITLLTQASIEEVSEVFEFVEGLCDLKIESVSLHSEEMADPFPNTAQSTEADIPAKSSIIDAPPTPSNATDFPVQTLEPGGLPEDSGVATEPAIAKKKANPTVRVDIERIDRLVNLVGELVINQAMLSQSIQEAPLPANTMIDSRLDEFLQLTRDIQESVMKIRAQPVKSLFQRMSRIVRESSAAVSKTVVFETEGETTEIDKTVIERLADPLTHMIRNAVDHGLEDTETRQTTGKPSEGRIRLTASHRSGRVVIEISDDGGGINRTKVRQIAVEKNLISADAELSDTEIDHLLFLPGFSTAEQVSNLSGRGVGMDVVKNAISSLGGRISITSTRNVGTVFSISLPLTLAVLDGMVVKVEAETLVIPLNAIVETQSLSAENIEKLGSETSVVSIRNEFVPLLDLGVELGFREPRPSYENAIALLVAQEDGSRAALVIDAIEDQRQVVIKGLQDSYGRVPGIAAATILGNGQIALILDAVDLLAHANQRNRAKPVKRKVG